jgi:hypothetical protein
LQITQAHMRNMAESKHNCMLPSPAPHGGLHHVRAAVGRGRWMKRMRTRPAVRPSLLPTLQRRLFAELDWYQWPSEGLRRRCPSLSKMLSKRQAAALKSI